jgi:hypothetical protein
MIFVKILTATLLGTTLMTLFSYYLSSVRKKQFREPELLNESLVRLRIMSFATSKNHAAGWFIHYVVGLLFVVCYELVIRHTSLSPTLSFFALAGGLCGLIGIAGWHITLILLPNPPVVHLKEYYIQLFVAHILFGLGAYGGYRLW